MLPLDAQQIANAWLEASRDLGIQVVSPFLMEENGEVIQFLALVPQFGSPKGMVLLEHTNWKHIRVAQAQGYATYAHMDVMIANISSIRWMTGAGQMI